MVILPYRWRTNKKKSGNFDVTESKKLCELFKRDFDYLFATGTEQKRESERK